MFKIMLTFVKKLPGGDSNPDLELWSLLLYRLGLQHTITGIVDITYLAVA